MKTALPSCVLFLAAAIAVQAQYIFTNLTPGIVNPWQCLASSADTREIVACGDMGTVYTSRDGGATWAQATDLPNAQWFSCYASSNGSDMLVASSATSQPYLSTNAGINWTHLTNNGLPAGLYDYFVMVGSADGQNLLIGEDGNFNYHSSNGGQTWAETANVPAADQNSYWNCAACSADGNTAIFGSYGHNLVETTDAGTHWADTTTTAGLNWGAVVCNASGTLWLAAEWGNGAIVNGRFVGGALYISSDSGGTWNQVTNSPLGGWQCAAMTPDGRTMAVGDRYSGAVWISTDSGGTWNAASATYSNNWYGVALSSDGTQLLAAAYYMQVVRGSALPRLSISASPGGATLSWPALITGFVLQQNNSIDFAGWHDTTNFVNTISGSNTVFFPMPPQTRFFRLRHP